MKFVVCVNKERFGDLSGEDVTIGHVSLTVLSLRASGARLAQPLAVF